MEQGDLARMRLDYETAGIDEADFPADPFTQFERWLAEAVAAEAEEPNAMVVSTVDAEGQPWSRYVLLKGVDRSGFAFYTNYESEKSVQLAANPRASLTFGWLELHRQVNVTGTVERVSYDESGRYWSTRTRGAQLAAWASAQSRPLASRHELMTKFRSAEERFPGEVPRPPHWGGWRVVPHTVEFWQGRRNRLHDRLRYVRCGPADADRDGWDLVRLAP